MLYAIHVRCKLVLNICNNICNMFQCNIYLYIFNNSCIYLKYKKCSGNDKQEIQERCYPWGYCREKHALMRERSNMFHFLR